MVNNSLNHAMNIFLLKKSSIIYQIFMVLKVLLVKNTSTYLKLLSLEKLLSLR